MADNSKTGGTMQAIHWIYNHLCAKHPWVSEVVLIVLCVIIIHFGFAYIRDTASIKVADQPPQSVNTSVTTTGDKSPAIAGHDNSVVYKDGQPKKDDSEKKEK